MNESLERFLDDPVKTTETVTIACAASFVVVHELVPPQHANLVALLGMADFLLNATCIRILRKHDNTDNS